MWKEHEKLEIKSLSPNLPKLEIEINFSGDKREVIQNKDKVVRLQIGKETTDVSFESLWTTLFLMADEEKQEKMLPPELGMRRKGEQWLTLRAEQDIKKGETIRVKHEVDIPEYMFEDTDRTKKIKREKINTL